MTTLTATTDVIEWIHATERRMYDAEVALHIARQSGVDAWVSAAAQRLHLAIVENRIAVAHLEGHCA